MVVLELHCTDEMQQCLLILTFYGCLIYVVLPKLYLKLYNFYSAKCEYIAQTQVNLSGIIIVIMCQTCRSYDSCLVFRRV